MTLAHTVVGSGEKTVVLLHGFLGSGRNLRTLALKLVEADPRKRCVLIDLPGHGESPPARLDETLQTMAKAVLDTVAVSTPVHWIGHSLGGRVALAAVDVAVESVASVSMLDISPSKIETEDSESGAVLAILRKAPATAPSRAEMRAHLISQRLSPGIADWLLTNFVSEEGSLRWRFDREALHALHMRVNAQDLWPVVERRERPLLEVRGARSKYVSGEDAERLATFGARVVDVEAGHFVHVEALEPLTRELVDWTR